MEQLEKISFAAYEAMEDRHERRENRYIRLMAFLVSLLVASNAGWLIYESMQETVVEAVTTTVTQDGPDGNNNYNHIGGDGDIGNG